MRKLPYVCPVLCHDQAALPSQKVPPRPSVTTVQFHVPMTAAPKRSGFVREDHPCGSQTSPAELLLTAAFKFIAKRLGWLKRYEATTYVKRREKKG